MARLNFAEYNFDKLVAQLKAVIQEEDAWKDINIESGTGAFLVELFSYVTEMVMYYLERRAQESYIDTAQLKSSITRLVDLLGYRPKRKTSATGNLTFTLPGGWHDGDIYIPRGTIVKTAAGLQYFVSQDAVLRRGETSVVVPGMQGALVTEDLVADGTPNASITIDDVNVEDTHIRILIDNVEWTMVDSYADTDAESLVFKQETYLDDRVKITFGDGKFGKIPPLNAEIFLEYVDTDGAEGNVYALSQINVIESTIMDDEDVDVTALLTVSNSSLFLGGDDAEDADEIRREAPRVFKTGDRAVTREDYITALENFPGIMTAYVWGERDEDPPNITYFNKVRIACLLQNWVNPDTAFKTQISEYLESKEQLTVWLDFVNATVIETIADVEIKVLESYQQSTIIANVTSALDAKFALGVVKLGVPIRQSDIISAVEGVTGVDYCYVTFSHKELIGTGDGGTVFTATLNLLPVKTGIVEIYVNSVKVAEDNGLGVITGTGVSGSIVYNTGYINVTFSTPPETGASIYAVYQQDQKGDIVVAEKQIAKVIEKNITIL